QQSVESKTLFSAVSCSPLISSHIPSAIEALLRKLQQELRSSTVNTCDFLDLLRISYTR
ncbi:unnamed protein product, partial [Prunus brigantina]